MALPPIDPRLAPLARLALRHLDVEGQVIWWDDGAWSAQDDDEAMLDAEEIAFYAEGLLAEGFHLAWQALAEVEAPDRPLFVRLFFWQGAPPPALPELDPGWQVFQSGEARA